MNKLTALSKLAGAYHHIKSDGTCEDEYPRVILKICFEYVLHSLTLEDLRPVPKCTEGFNGKMPTHL